MRVEVIMPRMGQGMEEGVILSWLKPVGADVKRGDPLIEIESDKATVEIEAFANGKLAQIVIPAGATAPIGAVLGYIESTENLERIAAPPIQANQPVKASQALVNRAIAASPVAQRLAQEHGLDLKLVTGTGPGGRIIKEDVEAAVKQSPSIQVAQIAQKAVRLDVSPVARKLARDNGIELATLTGSAPNGRIIKRDIMAALDLRQSVPIIDQSVAVQTDRQSARTVINLSKARRAAAGRMVESKTTIPHFYLTMDVDMGRALQLRESLKKRGRSVSVNDLILKATALALVEYPSLNATYDGDSLIANEHINLAIAVALGEKAHPDGLITPVIHNCEVLSLAGLGQRSADVAQRARTGKLKLDELSGATFTVSNLGMFGIRQFQAIINPPQVAILAVGAVQKIAVFDEQDRITPRQQVSVTLSADHRVTDGAEAAGFLGVFKDALEDAFRLLD